MKRLPTSLALLGAFALAAFGPVDCSHYIRGEGTYMAPMKYTLAADGYIELEPSLAELTFEQLDVLRALYRVSLSDSERRFIAKQMLTLVSSLAQEGTTK